jgi:hypothetical protein
MVVQGWPVRRPPARPAPAPRRPGRRCRWHAGPGWCGRGHISSWCGDRRGRRPPAVTQRNPSVEGGGDVAYLYWNSQSAWSMPVSKCEGREPRQVKAAAKRERRWYRPRRTCLAKYRILLRHDAAGPGFPRASGRKRGTDNESVSERVGADVLADPGAAGDPGDGPGGAVPVQPPPV